MAVSLKKPDVIKNREEYFVASQWQLMRRKFFKHKLAVAGSGILIVMYLLAIFCDFIAPYDTSARSEYIYMKPQRVRFVDNAGKFQLRPFIYGIKKDLDPETFERLYVEDREITYPVRFFTPGFDYKLLGVFPAKRHLFGVEAPGRLFLFGTDNLGRDFFSRNAYAARISLSIGLVGVSISFVLGLALGGISGYYGGTPDMIIQRVIEFLLSIPKIPLWMALAAALPLDWPVLKVYFGITVILSMISWTGLARVVRGKLLQLREEDFCTAAKISGARDWHIIAKHLLPSFMSFLIVNLTLAVPGMILAETALSFLGIGLRSPAVSWGVLLQDAQNVRTVALHPWLLLAPAVQVIVTVLTFNFVGDGLRDAADPYK